MKKTFRLIGRITIIAIMMLAFNTQTIEASGEKSLDSMNDRLLEDINALRIEEGVVPLSVEKDLTKIAMVRSKEASVLWSHIRPDGTHGYDMVEEDQWSGENLAFVKYVDYDFTEEELVKTADFMYANLVASPSHYDNMIFGSFKKIGIYTYPVSSEEGTKFVTAFMFSD